MGHTCYHVWTVGLYIGLEFVTHTTKKKIVMSNYLDGPIPGPIGQLLVSHSDCKLQATQIPGQIPKTASETKSKVRLTHTLFSDVYTDTESAYKQETSRPTTFSHMCMIMNLRQCRVSNELCTQLKFRDSILVVMAILHLTTNQIDSAVRGSLDAVRAHLVFQFRSICMNLVHFKMAKVKKKKKKKPFYLEIPFFLVY